jgi:transcriptional regulator with XRE-family HTH domain
MSESMKKGRPSSGVHVDAHFTIHALAEQLELNNMTWTQLAHEARLDERTLRRWRSGDTSPSLRDIERALAAVGYELVLMSTGGRSNAR